MKHIVFMTSSHNKLL